MHPQSSFLSSPIKSLALVSNLRKEREDPNQGRVDSVELEAQRVQGSAVDPPRLTVCYYRLTPIARQISQHFNLTRLAFPSSPIVYRSIENYSTQTWSRARKELSKISNADWCPSPLREGGRMRP